MDRLECLVEDVNLPIVEIGGEEQVSVARGGRGQALEDCAVRRFELSEGVGAVDLGTSGGDDASLARKDEAAGTPLLPSWIRNWSELLATMPVGARSGIDTVIPSGLPVPPKAVDKSVPLSATRTLPLLAKRDAPRVDQVLVGMARCDGTVGDQVGEVEGPLQEPEGEFAGVLDIVQRVLAPPQQLVQRLRT
jgi:hypothetical protein